MLRPLQLMPLTIPAMAQVLKAPELSARSKAQALADFTQVVFAELEAAAR